MTEPHVVEALYALIEIVGEFRSSHGRDALRNLPFGMTLDYLDMGRCPGDELERTQSELGQVRTKLDEAVGLLERWRHARPIVADIEKAATKIRRMMETG